MGRDDRRYDDRSHTRDHKQHESHHRKTDRHHSPPPLPRRDTPRHNDRPGTTSSTGMRIQALNIFCSTDERGHHRHRQRSPPRPRSPPPLRPRSRSPPRPRDFLPRRASRPRDPSPRHTPSKRQRSPKRRPDREEHKSRRRASREGPQQPVTVTARLRRQVAVYEVGGPHCEAPQVHNHVWW